MRISMHFAIVVLISAPLAAEIDWRPMTTESDGHPAAAARCDRDADGNSDLVVVIDGRRVLLRTRIDADAHRELIAVDDQGALWLGSKVQTAIVVDTTDDSIDFGGAQQVGDLPGPDGKISLREAITAANNTTGTQAGRSICVPSTAGGDRPVPRFE